MTEYTTVNMTEYTTTVALKRASWGSIFAGVATMLAVSIVMSIFGIALGFTAIDPLSPDPMHGVGMAFGIWSAITVIVSLFAGGYVAGYLAITRGWAHGLVVWAAALVLSVCMSVAVAGAAVKAAGNVVETAVVAAGNAAGGVASGAGSLAGSALDKIDLNVNMDDLDQNTLYVLRNMGIRELQPEYIKNQIGEARSDLRRGLHQLHADPQSFDSTIDGVIDRQKQRVDILSRDVNREDAINNLVRNTNMDRAQAEAAADRALATYQNTLGKARDSLDEAGRQLEDTKAYLNDLSQRAQIKADEVRREIRKSAVIAGIALVIGAVISTLAGAIGSTHIRRRYPEGTYEDF